MARNIAIQMRDLDWDLEQSIGLDLPHQMVLFWHEKVTERNAMEIMDTLSVMFKCPLLAFSHEYLIVD